MHSRSELKEFFGELKRNLWSVETAAGYSGFHVNHVRNRLSTGDILGVKLGRDWWTTKEAVDMYLELDRRPGPKTD